VSVTATASVTPTITGTPPTATASPTPTPLGQGTFTGEVVRLVNEYRRSLGLTQLTAQTHLWSVAGSYAKYMADRDFFGHDAPNGSTSHSRVANSGYPGDFLGECLAAGQETPEQVVTAWKGSPGHDAILRNPAARHVGIGYFNDASEMDTYHTYWVLVIGEP
jgi:uncharacterized protein YkwD